MIIAEGGSTKLDIVIIDEQNEVRRYSLPGINPFYQSTAEMTSTLKKSQILEENRITLESAVSFLLWISPPTECRQAGVDREHKVEDFPGGPGAKTASSQCRGPRFDLWSGN